MLCRSSRRRVALSLLGVLLFAQAALAAAACDWARAAPAQALAAVSDQPSCHEAPARNANLCLAHCLGADQSADTPQVQVPVQDAGPVLVVALPEVLSQRLAHQRHASPLPAGPPPRILFQSFLI
jgi:hypothetical protein